MAAEQTKREGKFLILFSLTELQSKHVRPLATNVLQIHAVSVGLRKGKYRVSAVISWGG
jgi:hypothetical protein